MPLAGPHQAAQCSLNRRSYRRHPLNVDHTSLSSGPTHTPSLSHHAARWSCSTDCSTIPPAPYRSAMRAATAQRCRMAAATPEAQAPTCAQRHGYARGPVLRRTLAGQPEVQERMLPQPAAQALWSRDAASLISLRPVKRSVRSPCSSARLERHFADHYSTWWRVAFSLSAHPSGRPLHPNPYLCQHSPTSHAAKSWGSAPAQRRPRRMCPPR